MKTKLSRTLSDFGRSSYKETMALLGFKREYVFRCSRCSHIVKGHYIDDTRINSMFICCKTCGNTAHFLKKDLKKMEIEFRKGIDLVEGQQYKGIINDVRYKEDPYRYAGFIIAVLDEEGQDSGTSLKVDFPLSMTTKSGLYEFLNKFENIAPETKINIEQIVKGRLVSFLIKKKKSEKGEFVNVIKESINPVKLDKE